MRFLLLAAVPFTLPGQTGQQLFESSCAGCHGLDGKGGEHAPNIATRPEARNLADSTLTHIVSNGITGSGMPAFASVFKPGQINTVIAYLRTLQGTSKTIPVSGNAATGRTLFEGEAHCTQCHMVNGRGGFLASDLSGYKKSHAPDELRQQLLTHKGITRVVTHGGKAYEGIIRNEDNFSLQLQTLDGDFLFLKRSDLLTIDQPASLQLNNNSLDNLISYLFL